MLWLPIQTVHTCCTSNVNAEESQKHEMAIFCSIHWLSSLFTNKAKLPLKGNVLLLGRTWHPVKNVLYSHNRNLQILKYYYFLSRNRFDLGDRLQAQVLCLLVLFGNMSHVFQPKLPSRCESQFHQIPYSRLITYDNPQLPACFAWLRPTCGLVVYISSQNNKECKLGVEDNFKRTLQFPPRIDLQTSIWWFMSLKILQ